MHQCHVQISLSNHTIVCINELANHIKNTALLCFILVEYEDGVVHSPLSAYKFVVLASKGMTHAYRPTKCTHHKQLT